MDDGTKEILRKHSDLALLSIDANQNLLQLEYSTELQKQRVAQTTYVEWKRDHIVTMLQRIRNHFCVAHCQAIPAYSHETTVECKTSATFFTHTVSRLLFVVV